MKKIVVTVIGADRVGIVAGVAKQLAEENVNILDISQTIVDGIFVGRGVGTGALGAVNLAQPLVMIIGAVFMWKWSAIIFSGIPPLRSPPPLPPPCRASAGTTARRCSSWFPPSSAPL